MMKVETHYLKTIKFKQLLRNAKPQKLYSSFLPQCSTGTRETPRTLWNALALIINMLHFYKITPGTLLLLIISNLRFCHFSKNAPKTWFQFSAETKPKA